MLAVRTTQLPPAVLIPFAYTGAEKEQAAMNNDNTHNPNSESNSDFTLGDDLITGAEQIARELQWKMKDGRWNRRRVYHLAAQGLDLSHFSSASLSRSGCF